MLSLLCLGFSSCLQTINGIAAKPNSVIVWKCIWHSYDYSSYIFLECIDSSKNVNHFALKLWFYAIYEQLCCDNFIFIYTFGSPCVCHCAVWFVISNDILSAAYVSVSLRLTKYMCFMDIYKKNDMLKKSSSEQNWMILEMKNFST